MHIDFGTTKVKENESEIDMGETDAGLTQQKTSNANTPEFIRKKNHWKINITG